MLSFYRLFSIQNINMGDIFIVYIDLRYYICKCVCYAHTCVYMRKYMSMDILRYKYTSYKFCPSKLQYLCH